MMGLPGFEPGSIAPEATSLDQTSRQPPIVVCIHGFYLDLPATEISVLNYKFRVIVATPVLGSAFLVIKLIRSWL